MLKLSSKLFRVDWAKPDLYIELIKSNTFHGQRIMYFTSRLRCKCSLKEIEIIWYILQIKESSFKMLHNYFWDFVKQVLWGVDSLRDRGWYDGYILLKLYLKQVSFKDKIILKGKECNAPNFLNLSAWILKQKK